MIVKKMMDELENELDKENIECWIEEAEEHGKGVIMQIAAMNYYAFRIWMAPSIPLYYIWDDPDKNAEVFKDEREFYSKLKGILKRENKKPPYMEVEFGGKIYYCDGKGLYEKNI